MPCYHPLTAYKSKDVGVSGKRGIVFNSPASLTGIPMKLPCGQCIGCRLERSRQWACRCVHESMLYKDNLFVTLTYDEKNLPCDGTLVKRDLQLFMKRLRFEKGKGIRFYACGEYGDVTSRPHYHVLLFNCWFADRKTYARGSDTREPLFTSEALSRLWPQGLNVIGDVTFDSAAYVARYCVKKITGPMADDHYMGRAPEFTVMSRRPGIGMGWFEKYGGHAYAHDSVVMNGMEVRPPRFYDTKYEVVDAQRLSRLKSKRRRKAMALAKPDKSRERREVCEAVAYATLNAKGRVL